MREGLGSGIRTIVVRKIQVNFENAPHFVILAAFCLVGKEHSCIDRIHWLLYSKSLQPEHTRVRRTDF